MILSGQCAGSFILLVSDSGVTGFRIVFTRGIGGLSEGIRLSGTLLAAADLSGDSGRRRIFSAACTAGELAGTGTE